LTSSDLKFVRKRFDQNLLIGYVNINSVRYKLRLDI